MAATDLMSIEDQRRLELGLKTRESIVLAIMANGPIPKVEDRGLLMQALDGMDRSILSKAKIKSDDSAAKSAAESAKNIAELLLRVDARKRNPGNAVDVEATVLPPIQLVEGETFIGVQPVKYNDVMNIEN